MSIIDFKAMKQDKELFDNMANRLIKDALNKKKRYETLYNKANMLKNEINQILVKIQHTCYEHSIPLNKDIHDYSYKELEELLVDVDLPNSILEGLRINIYKIKIRLDQINKLRTEMIKLDLYENHLNAMEDDTLDEEYIDMDRIREERGIDLINNIDAVLDQFNYKDLISNEEDYYEYKFEGIQNLKSVAKEIYGNPSYWVYIYNYSDNSKKISKIALDKIKEIDEVVVDGELLKDISIKIPKEIDFYSEEFNTAVLKKIS